MKKILLMFIFAGVSFSLRALDVGTSVSYAPFLSTHNIIISNDVFDMGWDFGQQVVYQADLKNRAGFNFGFGVKYDSGYDINDNAVGVLSDILGYVGFKNFSVKVKHLTLPGLLTLAGNPAPGQPLTRKTNNKKTTVELLYRFFDEYADFYLGIYYSFYEWASANSIDFDEMYNEFGGGVRGRKIIFPLTIS